MLLADVVTADSSSWRHYLQLLLLPLLPPLPLQSSPNSYYACNPFLLLCTMPGTSSPLRFNANSLLHFHYYKWYPSLCTAPEDPPPNPTTLPDSHPPLKVFQPLPHAPTLLTIVPMSACFHCTDSCHSTHCPQYALLCSFSLQLSNLLLSVYLTNKHTLNIIGLSFWFVNW